MGIEVNGVIGLLVLVANVWAIINVLQAPTSTGKKVLWTIAILLLPVLGFVVWFFAGPRSS